MSELLDETDRKILRLLQNDATLSMDSLADQVHLSRNACWRRVRQMEQSGVITAKVALADPAKLGHGQSVIVLLRAGSHTPDWLEQFERAVQTLPEIVGAYRTSGDLDYVLRVRVADVQDYDRFYQTLIRRVPIANVSASFVMEELKETTAIPV